MPEKPHKFRALASIVTGAALFATGLVAGSVAAAQRSSPAGEGAAGGHAAAPPHFDRRTLGNLGVEVAAASPATFVRTVEIPAVVRTPGEATRPVASPVAGTVRRVLVRAGSSVRAGEPVAEVLRDPFARPSLALTDAVLRPLQEEHHAMLSELRSARLALAIASDELERIRGLLRETAPGAAKSKLEIDAEYEERRARRGYDDARMEAERHGLSEEEIASAEAGAEVARGPETARRVLAHARLWSQEADELLAILPERLRSTPLTTAILGELTGAGLLGPGIVRLFRSQARLAEAFADVAGLLQAGWTAAALEELVALGALEDVVVVRAPADGEEWEIRDVEARPGRRIERGEALLRAEDRRFVLLELRPSGLDAPALEKAMLEGATFSAEPLLRGAGAEVAGLRLERIAAAEGRTPVGVARVANERLAAVEVPGEARVSTWRLAEGQKFLARLPRERIEGRFVLPAEALVFRGAESLVLIEDGEGFREVVVRVEHRDARDAVVANDAAIFPGDRVVTRGAYALSLALRAGEQTGGDPHAGHSH